MPPYVCITGVTLLACLPVSFLSVMHNEARTNGPQPVGRRPEAPSSRYSQDRSMLDVALFLTVLRRREASMGLYPGVGRGEGSEG